MNVTGVDTDSNLHRELIEYATASFRLLFIQEDSVFADFQSTGASNDLSTNELSAIFLNDILPNVYAYQLTESVKKRLKFLDLHPGIRRTPQGFQYAPQHLGASFALTPRCDFSLAEQLPELLPLSAQGNRRVEKKFRLNAPTRDAGASHTVLVVDPDARPNASPKFQLSLDIATLLSAMVSTNLELSSAQLHNLHEIQRRLRRAKQSFEDNGRVLPYRNNLELLTNYIASFEKLKANLCRALSSF